MRLVDDQESAEDLVQDVFVGLTRRPVVLDDPIHYLRRAVVNRSRSMLRRRQIARAFWARRQVLDPGEPADESSLQHAARQQMLHAIARLPRRQREVVVLHYYEDLAVTKIAEVLNISPGAVSSALNRALGSLALITEDRHAD
jgi:RNA polymerase sigma factor (sigma-70 family)